MKGECTYQIKLPILDWGEKEIAIGIQCDAGQISTKAGNRAQIGIFGFMRKQKLNFLEVGEFHQWVAISWISSKSQRLPHLKKQCNISSLLWFRHGQDVKGGIIRITFRKYRGRNTDICAQR